MWKNFSLDLVFHNNFWKNIKSFSKQNSNLRIYSKPDRNQSLLTMCSASYRIFAVFSFFFALPFVHSPTLTVSYAKFSRNKKKSASSFRGKVHGLQTCNKVIDPKLYKKDAYTLAYTIDCICFSLPILT